MSRETASSSQGNDGDGRGSLYVGYHNDAGEAVVMVDGRELTLPPSMTPTRRPVRYAWGETGRNANQLALAILIRETDRETASRHFGAFVERVVSTLPREWTLTSASVRDTLRRIEADTSHEVG